MQEWNIPADLLCFHSKYFRSALQGEFAEAKTKRVELLNEKPEAFKLVVEWLYTHEIKASGRNANGFTSIDSEEPGFSTLLDTWMLADYLDLPKLQNFIMKMKNERVKHHQDVPIEEVNRVYPVCFDSPFSDWILDACLFAIPQNYDMADYFSDALDRSLLQEHIFKRLVFDIFVGLKEVILDENHLVKE